MYCMHDHACTIDTMPRSVKQYVMHPCEPRVSSSSSSHLFPTAIARGQTFEDRVHPRFQTNPNLELLVAYTLQQINIEPGR